MNLNERLRSSHGNIIAAEDIDLAADIIDSLPKAEDGSVIVPDFWGVFDNRSNDAGIEALLIQGVSKYGGKVYVYADDDEWDASEILSTHRTRAEAEAAAAKAEEENEQ